MVGIVVALSPFIFYYHSTMDGAGPLSERLVTTYSTTYRTTVSDRRSYSWSSADLGSAEAGRYGPLARAATTAMRRSVCQLWVGLHRNVSKFQWYFILRNATLPYPCCTVYTK